MPDVARCCSSPVVRFRSPRCPRSARTPRRACLRAAGATTTSRRPPRCPMLARSTRSACLRAHGFTRSRRSRAERCGRALLPHMACRPRAARCAAPPSPVAEAWLLEELQDTWAAWSRIVMMAVWSRIVMMAAHSQHACFRCRKHRTTAPPRAARLQLRARYCLTYHDGRTPRVALPPRVRPDWLRSGQTSGRCGRASS